MTYSCTPLPAGRVAIAAGVLALVSSGIRAADVVTIHPEKIVGPVNRLVFGQNMLAYQGSRKEYGLWGAGIWNAEQNGPQDEFVELAKEAGCTMMRWPGGCGAHRYNWKKTVGPLVDRPEQRFGLPEFVRFCEACGAAPMITLAGYWGSASDAADIVEYLNRPADGSNPNGGKDWAALRASDGRPEPWNVVWFEYGNETDHGDHHGTKMTVEQYCRNYLDYRAAMRAVDPRIKLGAILKTGSLGENDGWTVPVLKNIGKEADYVIYHTYKPNYYKNDGLTTGLRVAQACMAASKIQQRIYTTIREFAAEHAGRPDLPVAVTEYNGHFVQAKPVPYRHCHANAINNADHLRVMMRPGNCVACAVFWQFSNEYWGCARGYPQQGEKIVKQANYYVFEMYHRHFGEQLVEAEVECESFDCTQGLGVPPCIGEASEYKELGRIPVPDATWELAPAPPHTKHNLKNGELVVDFEGGEDTNYYHATIKIQAEPNTGYRFTALAMTEGLEGGEVGFQVGDARGWDVTQSARLNTPLNGTTDWTEITVPYVTLPDAKAIHIMARRLGGKGKVKGRARFGRIVKIEKFQPRLLGAVPLVSVNASRSADGKTVYAMIVHKRLEEAGRVVVNVPKRYSKARAWVLSSPSPVATNLDGSGAISVKPLDVEGAAGRFALNLPPCSLTALEVSE